jgi:hypothetical protein
MTDPDEFEPGPNQRAVNKRQGTVNRKQGDLNDELVAAQDDRQDAAEATAAAVTERRDAEHVAQGVLNEAAAVTDERRDAEHDAQGVINEAHIVTDERRDAEHDAQARANVDQAAINAAAVAALLRVGEAAKDVTDLLRENVARGRKWTKILAAVLAVVIALGVAQFITAQAQNRRTAEQRQAIKAQATDFCRASAERTRALKRELIFLVNTATDGATDPAAIEFRKNYPAHLDEVIAPVTDC